MKRNTVNQLANKKMKEYCVLHDITRCELCGSTFGLSFAHAHKRHWYYDKPVSWLWDRPQWKLLCIPCHQRIEFDKEATNKLFGGK